MKEDMQSKKKILLVEDDSAIVDVYKTIMESAGFEVDTAGLGQDVIRKMKKAAAGEEAKPDIVLLDLILPDMNGVEILKEIKQNPATKDVAVFILTNQEESQLPKLEGIKPDKFIIKANVTPTDLLELVKQQLG